MKFSYPRLIAVIQKEFIQIIRDRSTFAMIIGIPLIQIILFGYAINSDPKHLPTAIIAADQSAFVRTFIQGMHNSGYFDIITVAKSEQQTQDLLKTGKVQFVVNIPANFTHDLIRGSHPSILVEIDDTDPGSSSNPINTLNELASNIFNKDFQGNLHYLQTNQPPVNINVHLLHNPEQKTQYNIVPGLAGMVLTMTMVIITATAITRERERGTMEYLLSTPLQASEVMIGKVIPYIIVGYLQLFLVLLASRWLFAIPILGSITLLLILTLPFIAANLAVGLLFSAAARNQLQAVQLSNFFFLPSILLSGNLFSFRGMPTWAQILGQVLPLTHYVRIIRGILLKGNGLAATWPDLWPILVFLVAIILLGVKRFHRTLD